MAPRRRRTAVGWQGSARPSGLARRGAGAHCGSRQFSGFARSRCFVRRAGEAGLSGVSVCRSGLAVAGLEFLWAARPPQSRGAGR